MPAAIRLGDHIIISIIISLQFLFCVFSALVTGWFFLYAGSSGGFGGALLLWLAYMIAGIVSAVRLQKKGIRRRVEALLWNACLGGYIVFHGGVNGRHRYDSYIAIYNICATVYLAVASAAGFAGEDSQPVLEREQEQQ